MRKTALTALALIALPLMAQAQAQTAPAETAPATAAPATAAPAAAQGPLPQVLLPDAVAGEAPRLSAIIAALEEHGLMITDIDVDRDHIEIEARSADNVEWDIRIDPATGNVLEAREDR